MTAIILCLIIQGLSIILLGVWALGIVRRMDRLEDDSDAHAIAIACGRHIKYEALDDGCTD